MPNRIIRDGIIDSRAVNSLSEEAELFYRHLHSVVDDFGRMEAEPHLLRVKLFPRRLKAWPEARIQRCLDECGKTLNDDGFPLVLCYQSGSKKYLEIQKFDQRKRAKQSKCPAPSVRHLSDARRSCDGHVSTQNDQVLEAKTRGEDERREAVRVIGLTKPLTDWVEELYSRHPKKKNFNLIGVALLTALEKSANQDALMDQINRAHIAWCKTNGWNEKDGAFAPKLDEWIGDRGYTKLPAGYEPTKSMYDDADDWKKGIDFEQLARERAEEEKRGKNTAS